MYIIILVLVTNNSDLYVNPETITSATGYFSNNKQKSF